jgi:hypothetical protein
MTFRQGLHRMTSERVMSDNTAGLSLDEEGDDFVLAVTGKDGTVSRVRLTEQQMMTLIQSTPAFRERIVLRHNPEGDSVSAVLVTRVSQIGIQPDSLGVDVLLTLVSSTGARLTFALSPQIARILIDRLPGVVEEIDSSKTTKQ